MLANQAAVAVEKPNWSATLEHKVAERTAELQAANRDLEQRNDELTIINSIQQGLAAELDFRAIVELVGDKLRDVFHTSNLTINWHDEKTGLLHYLFCCEHGERVFISPRPPTPGGLFESMSRTRESAIASTTADYPKLGLALIEGTDQSKSLIGVPVISSDRVLGIIVMEDYDRENAYGESEVRLLTTIAASLGTALESARLFEETQRLLKETEQRATELTTVNRISQALTSELEPDALINLVGEQIRQTFAADIVYVALHDPEANLIRFPYAFGEEMPSIPFGRGLTSHILRVGEPLLINQDVSGRSVELGEPVVGLPPKSYLGVPITVGNRVLGVISVQSTQQEDRFSEQDVHLLSTIAANVGTAIRNAQLYQETQRRADQMAAIAEVGREVSATLNLDAVLGNISAHVHRLFDAQDTVLRLAGPDGRIFRTTVALGLYAEQFKSDVIELGRGIHGSIAQTGFAEVIDNPDADPAAYTWKARRWWRNRRRR